MASRHAPRPSWAQPVLGVDEPLDGVRVGLLIPYITVEVGVRVLLGVLAEGVDRALRAAIDGATWPPNWDALIFN